MKRFYLTGQKTFGNRGCEAIVRSTVMLLNDVFDDVQVLVPSDNIKLDMRQWPDAEKFGVEFVQVYFPPYTRYWVHFQRLPFAKLKRIAWPFRFPKWFREQIASVDAVLSIGGDNYSLDYRLPSLLMGMDKLAMDMGKPVIIWGASVGPFEGEKNFVPAVTQHMAQMSNIMVRESVSYNYLTNILGLKNVTQMADPAFTLRKEQVNVEPFWPVHANNGVLGLNISPLIERYKNRGQDIRKEVLDFIHYAVEELNFSVLLVPHVVPLDGLARNNDAYYMDSLLQECSDLGESVKLVPSNFNASQYKFVISQLRFFIGARTHSTIAALSSGVPTVSIAYSVKAKGINKDIFGTEDPVLQTSDVSYETLVNALSYLTVQEDELKSILAKKIPEFQERVKHAALNINMSLHEKS